MVWASVLLAIVIKNYCAKRNLMVNVFLYTVSTRRLVWTNNSNVATWCIYLPKAQKHWGFKTFETNIKSTNRIPRIRHFRLFKFTNCRTSNFQEKHHTKQIIMIMEQRKTTTILSIFSIPKLDCAFLQTHKGKRLIYSHSRF
jgi:hypothetical protein